MTIKLQRLPFLVQEAIMKNMECDSIVMLSFCSSRMKTMIRASRLNLSMMLYRTYNSTTELVLQNSNGDGIHAYIMFTVAHLDDDFEILKLNNFEYCISAYLKMVLYSKSKFSRNYFLLHFHNHVLELFKTSPEIFHETGSNVDLATIKVFENTTQLRLEDRNSDYVEIVNSDFIEQLFSKCENLEGAIVEPIVDDEMSENSKLTTAKNLYFEHAVEQVEIIACHFKGHHAVFEDSECGNRTVEKIIRQWIANEAFQELKSMKIKQEVEGVFSPQFFHHYIQSERWDPARRPEHYENKTKIMDYEFESFECADFVDIQRKSDGKWASFKVTTDCFKFCVWD
ncbi:hypothetical protein CAEBREN_13275 [Caenorhabditis brenneri]|uniref:F-box domain-containing protein n=1 Tax=Caenorhabditis brenneri TaxID=135651 RepID=G0MP02_CAEBE|nr:hypothetical protein CAEBREN_13275 [Caenorhabditis brenneri]